MSEHWNTSTAAILIRRNSTGGLMASLTWIWVHRRHKGHRNVDLGARYVSAEVAAEMICDGCAQGVQTDPRHLKFPSENDPFTPPKPEPASALFESDGEDPPLLETAPPAKRRRGRPRKSTYKTTRMTPES